MLEFFIWWCVIGLVSGVAASALSFLKSGSIITADVVCPVLFCWLGPCLTVALIIYAMSDWMGSILKKKIYERKSK